MDEIAARVPVSRASAASLPGNPELAREYMRLAEEAMNGHASERGRTVAEPPRLVDIQESTFGDAVELHFVARTRPS